MQPLISHTHTQALVENTALNKMGKRVQAFNMDGRDFIR
jgi:tRNA G37 N-methylase Trm5